MSFLLAYDIERLIRTENLIEKPEYFTEEEWQARIQDIEGSQFDLTIDKLYSHSVSSSPYLGRYGRDTGRLVEMKLASFPRINEEGWQLYADSHYIGLTGESVSLPPHLTGLLAGRSSDYVIGLYPGVTNISPGYSGKLKFGLYATSNMKLGRGARIITLKFIPHDYVLNFSIPPEHIQPYGGIWGGDKVTTEGTERPS